MLYININKIKFETYGNLVNNVYSRLNETLINNQEPHSQIQNNEILGAEYPNSNDPEDRNKLNFYNSYFCVPNIT